MHHFEILTYIIKKHFTLISLLTIFEICYMYVNVVWNNTHQSYFIAKYLLLINVSLIKNC